MVAGRLDTPALLRRNLVFGALDDAVLRAVTRRMQSLTLPGGRLLFDAGEPSDALYVLRSGSIGVFRTPHAGGPPHLAGVVGSGETLGATGLLVGRPRPFSARALRDSELLRLTRDDFEALSLEHPQAILGAARSALQGLLAQGGGEPKLLPRTFAVLPFDADVPARETAERLRHELLPFGDCLLIDADLGSGRDPHWFAERESEVRFVLYVDDGRGDDDWRALCRRQADALLLLADAGSAPRPWPNRSAMDAHADLERPRHLLLLHPHGRIVAGAARAWLDALARPAQHHHLRGSSDMARLARLLARRSLGLVLSGGGGRGFAALGVVRAMREAGYDVDTVGGTSIGAIIGAGVALEWDDRTMHAAYRKAFVDGHPLRDWTLPLVALSRGARTARLLREAFGEGDIEDLPVPYFCVSADLTRGVAAIHRDGPLWVWLRASSAVPGILPPVFRHGRVHVDGAVINNLPTDVMTDRGMGSIVACDIGADDVLSTSLDAVAQPHAWRQWLQRHRRPGLAAILLRSGMVNAEAASAQRRLLATRVLAPPLGDIGLLDWRAFERAIEVGYRYASEALQAPLG